MTGMSFESRPSHDPLETAFLISTRSRSPAQNGRKERDIRLRLTKAAISEFYTDGYPGGQGLIGGPRWTINTT